MFNAKDPLSSRASSLHPIRSPFVFLPLCFVFATHSKFCIVKESFRCYRFLADIHSFILMHLIFFTVRLQMTQTTCSYQQNRKARIETIHPGYRERCPEAFAMANERRKQMLLTSILPFNPYQELIGFLLELLPSKGGSIT